jgi:hypothetical protein
VCARSTIPALRSPKLLRSTRQKGSIHDRRRIKTHEGFDCRLTST